ncbi:hypothetical protein PK69_21565 [Xanthomonas phaseoli pv. phaseoli]|uniref:Uncharacterized protein n=1 Tax=Xanthomonas campestris pv. phaseoli TaxID=317013 RepID=A0AB38DUP4_XANCH|nr:MULTISPECIES: hypothetical protein [Xanthomonas]AZU13564.1 hypothetical protein AC609_12855 [Xanthomonas phaseoli pv. phaseoli]AZU26331.1 hypothetical protein AC611_12915 [Xanthomonas phaseoli pv. phaseoli]AZU30681.1 hypothetical protein AC801_12680 [Xanthomonas sp. ISO98C4]AZU35090.1 hypothetical protein AC610_12850 [Xanthomonas phaseoli pv. phaseoli]KGT52214.1 hypothetical protein NZ02_05835 [Xanthomonas phaseoli pv. phaseoli]
MIADIISVIDGIAFQTTILVLNAALEEGLAGVLSQWPAAASGLTWLDAPNRSPQEWKRRLAKRLG